MTDVVGLSGDVQPSDYEVTARDAHSWAFTLSKIYFEGQSIQLLDVTVASEQLPYIQSHGSSAQITLLCVSG